MGEFHGLGVLTSHPEDAPAPEPEAEGEADEAHLEPEVLVAIPGDDEPHERIYGGFGD